MEDMLIARVKTFMQVRWTKGRQLAYKDHIVNFRQNITEIATKLPRLPEDLDIILIRREDVDMTAHVDYVVRREKIRQALQYKIENDPDYADLAAPDDDALSHLPENGSVVERITTCCDLQHADTVDNPSGPHDAAQDDSTDDDGCVFMGGVLDLDNTLREEVVEVKSKAQTVLHHRQYEQEMVCIFFLVLSDNHLRSSYQVCC